jgi:hypothetical protein
MGELRRARGATLAAHQHVVAGVLLGACVFAYLWPVLVGGKILSPIAALYDYVPWLDLQPPDMQRYHNWVLLDLPVVNFPWRFLVRQQLHEWVLPAWNPYVLSGSPFYNPQSGLFSAFNLPLWILPLTYGLGVSAALKLLVGGLGSYLLARQLRLGFLPALLAGIGFAFSAVNITWLAHDTLPAVTAMAPWAILFVERTFERGRSECAVAIAIVIATGLGGGHPGMQVHLLVVTSAYALGRAAFMVGRHPAGAPGRLHALALVGAGLAAGTLLMAFMLLPELRSAHETVGVDARRTQSLPGARLPLAALRTVVFPDWWGRPSAAEPPLNASNLAVMSANYCERTFYAGAVALVLAGIGLLSPGAWRRKAPFALIGLLGLAVAVRVPGLHWLATHLPILASVEAQRLHFAFAIASSLLAAFGLQALIDGSVPRPVAIGAPLVVTAIGGIGVLSAGLGSAGMHGITRHFLHGTEIAGAQVLALTSTIWFLVFAGGACAALLLARRRPWRRVAIAAIVVALAALDAYHFAGDFQPMGPQSRVVPPITPALSYLMEHRSDGRIAGVGALPNDWPLVYGLRDVRGYDPPQPTRRMFALWQTMTPGQIGWQPLSINALAPVQVRVLGVLGARYVIVPPGTSIDTSRRLLRTVYEGADAIVYENALAAPRAFAPARVVLTANERESHGRIVERGFDPRSTVTVARTEPHARTLVGQAHGDEPAGAVAIVRERNTSVELRATLSRRGLVVLDDQLTEGWSVHVDGRAAEPLHVDSVMRGVIVPAGRHTVEWRYAIPGLRVGATISVLTLAALLAAGGTLALRARRQRRITQLCRR